MHRLVLLSSVPVDRRDRQVFVLLDVQHDLQAVPRAALQRAFPPEPALQQHVLQLVAEATHHLGGVDAVAGGRGVVAEVQQAQEALPVSVSEDGQAPLHHRVVGVHEVHPVAAVVQVLLGQGGHAEHVLVAEGDRREGHAVSPHHVDLGDGRDQVHRRLTQTKKATTQTTRCGLDLSGEKANLKPWILVLVMKPTVTSFNVGEPDSGLRRRVSRASSALRGPGAAAAAAASAALTIIARVKALHHMLFLSSPPQTSPHKADNLEHNIVALLGFWSEPPRSSPTPPPNEPINVRASVDRHLRRPPLSSSISSMLWLVRCTNSSMLKVLLGKNLLSSVGCPKAATKSSKSPCSTPRSPAIQKTSFLLIWDFR
ncbi:hypothetical protein EYF80_034405 [Liparis tanakae]|uniref:Uncharacterized protein n=1 Tax=Liparis tanakae TaxID=230148 RepID=A0A4Z2GRJ4_9TELE|nr:hypothetical protein EYF80_034405 [Liparis tanakae]